MTFSQADYRKMKRQERKAQRRSKRAREKRMKKEDKMCRAMANASHRTYQSPRELSSDGWMKQHVVNRVLSMFGGR